jgi:hypothetical protein
VEWYQQGNSWFIYQSSLEIVQGSHLAANQEEPAKEIMNFALGSLFHTWKGSLTCRKILRHGADGFTSPSNEGVLRTFIALKNPSPLARFEHANLGSNGKHANQQITEDDLRDIYFYIFFPLYFLILYCICEASVSYLCWYFHFYYKTAKCEGP